MIAIKDMVEMPKSCGECLRTEMCSTYLNQYVYHPSTRYSYGQDKRPNDCPLVEIVTCKDCKHRQYSYCDYHNCYLTKNGFCNNAKRRE